MDSFPEHAGIFWMAIGFPLEKREVGILAYSEIDFFPMFYSVIGPYTSLQFCFIILIFQ